MSSPANGTSKSSKNGKLKHGKDSKSEANGKNSSTNGESLLAPITHYEQTKLDSINKEYEEKKKEHDERLENYRKKWADFKKNYKAELIVYEKIKTLKGEKLSGTISEEQTYVRIGEVAIFENIEDSLKNYRATTIDFLYQKKQEVLESITDARRKRQVEINKQKKKKKPDSESTSPTKGSGQLHQKDPWEPQGSGVVNQTLLEKELNRESQLIRAEILINYLSTNKTALEKAHDKYVEYLNGAVDPDESALYSYYVARVQK